MTAVLVAAAFAGAAAAAGIGVARVVDPDRPPVALGASLALALLAVLGSTVATWTYHAAYMGGAWVVLVAASVSLCRGRGSLALVGPPVRRRLLILVATAACLPLLVLPVPLDTDAQGFGMLALAIRDGGTLSTLAPWHPEIAYLYAPGVLVLFASVSAVLPVGMPAVMLGVAHAALVLIAWQAWDLGDAVGRLTASSRAGSTGQSPWGWATSVAASLSLGLWTALADAHYTTIFGMLFAMAHLTCFFRFVDTGSRVDLAGASVALAAVAVSHPDSTLILGWGLLALLLAGVVVPQPGAWRRRWWAVLVVAPAGAALVAAPWLVSLRPLLDSGVRSPFTVSPSHWRQFVLYQGLAWPLLAVAGAWLWWRRGRPWVVAMTLWLALLLDASVSGAVARAVPGLRELERFSYPFSLAWHGPILPVLVLGGGALVRLWERSGRGAPELPGGRTLALGLALAGALLGTAQPLWQAGKRFATVQGAFASENDLRAMRWLRDRTPADARVLNYPGDYEAQRDWEAHWAPVVTERSTVYFRMQPFFVRRPLQARRQGRRVTAAGPQGLAAVYDEQHRMLAFWRDPLNPRHADLLRAAGITHVLVPESVGDPSSLASAWRSAPPALLPDARPQDLPGTTYLHLVYRAGGALVYEVLPPTGGAS